jgi:hypothetical protein
VKDEDLAGQLLDFLSEAHKYSPRRWAESNISCHRSTEILNQILKDHMKSLGQEWTQDVATLCWSPYPRLANAEEAPWLRSEREQIKSRFGVEIGEDQSSEEPIIQTGPLHVTPDLSRSDLVSRGIRT